MTLGGPQQRLAADRALHLPDRIPTLGHRLCSRGVGDPVLHHPGGGDDAVPRFARTELRMGQTRQSPGRIAATAALALAALIMAAPLLWTLLLSLKPNAELLRGTSTAFAPPYTLQNYADIFGHSAVFGWLLNSAIVSLGVTFGVLALSSPRRIRLRAAALSRPRRDLHPGALRPRHSRAIGDHRAPPDVQRACASQHLWRTDLSGTCCALRRVPDDPVFPRHAEGARGSGVARRRLAVAHVLEDPSAAVPAGAGDAGHLHLPWRPGTIIGGR